MLIYHCRESDEMEIEVTESDSGQRLDIFLAGKVEGLSRRRAQDLIDKGKVLRNGHSVRKGIKVEVGDEIQVLERPALANDEAVKNANIGFEVHFEDEHFVIVEKPAGMPTHPLKSNEDDTLANGLASRYPEMQGVGFSPLQPGLVNRLDIDTSGLVLASRTEKAWKALREIMVSSEMTKGYTSLCEGTVASPRTLDWYLVNDSRDRRKVHACETEIEAQRLGARPAQTRVVSALFHLGFSTAHLEVRSAFRHQIRVHMAMAGHPLLGDTLYGGRSVEGQSGHLLHASSLRFPHPFESKMVHIESKTPVVFGQVVESLGSTTKQH